MLKPSVLAALLLLLILLPAVASAQVICPLNGNANSSLVCLIPQVYGAFGLGSGPTAPLLANAHQAHFENDFISSFGPINEEVGIQASQLPLASPSGAITFVYDAALKTFIPSTEETLGPIFGERATTIGKGKFYIATSYQYFGFSTIDGQSTHNIPVVFQHQPFPNPMAPLTPCPNQSGLPAKYAGDPCFVRDFIQTFNSIDVKIHQIAVYVTYGLTSNLDISMAVPILDVRMGVKSDATIVNNAVAPPIASFPFGVFHQFNPAVVASCASTPAGQPCRHGTFADFGDAAGIGDIVVRGKYTVHRWEKAALAAGLNWRAASGDSHNFLGSGGNGVQPFAVFSYGGRISPHGQVGYEWNGNSILAGSFAGTPCSQKTPTNCANGVKQRLPNRFVYTAGVDAAVTKRLTGAFDFYGQHLFQAPQLAPATYTDLGKCSDIACSTLTAGTTHPDSQEFVAGLNILSASVGAKYRVASNLVATGNVLLKLNDGGLRTRAVPLVGLSYTF